MPFAFLLMENVIQQPAANKRSGKLNRNKTTAAKYKYRSSLFPLSFSTESI